MPSIHINDTGGGNDGGGWSVPWKALGVIALISCSTAYGLYQYERYFPSKRTPANPAVAVAAPKKGDAALKKDLEKLNLSPDQRQKLATIQEETTNSRGKVQMALKVLNPEQRKEFRESRAEARKEAKARAQARQAKFFPNPQDAAYAKEANARIREARQARQKAAQQPASSGN